MCTSKVYNQFSQSEQPAYRNIAAEYYDEARHPTCAAFSFASAQLLTSYLNDSNIQTGMHICDVGAGRSVVAESLGVRVSLLGALYLVDDSSEMLKWSDEYVDSKIRRIIAPAAMINKLGTIFDLIIASLGDPYNTREFWESVSDALTPGGVCLLTTPSHGWASRYREHVANEHVGSAYFELRNGDRTYVPSFVLPEHDQVDLIRGVGLNVVETKHVLCGQIPNPPEKLTCLEAAAAAVTLYRIRKPDYDH